MDLNNKRVAVVGLAKSGMAVAELIQRVGGKVKISEKASADSVAAFIKDWPLKNKVGLECGGHTQKFIENSDLVVLSPGVRIDAEPVLWAKAKGIPVIGEIELAWSFCPLEVIAVTGSNGKTTVATLIAKVLERGGKKVCLCGNIGSPFSKHAMGLEGFDAVVLEVSSFHLESIVDFRPHVAVLLNFSQNHLDRHKDLEEYFTAKKRIFLNQRNDDYAVLNYEDPMVRSVASGINAIISYFNPPGINRRVEIRNPNQLAAMEVGRIYGVSPETCLQVFGEFKGVEHRLEWVRTKEGIDFINDSKATTAEAGRWALSSIQRPIVMICGGRDKNIDFSVLRDLVKSKVKKMFVIGEAKDKLTKAFGDVVAVGECGSLKDAVEAAKAFAAKGDCVVFSPMCASFDMFKNFEERGKVFKEIVWALQ